MSTLVDELEDVPGTGGVCTAGDWALDLLASSAFGAVEDDEELLELLDWSPGAACWLWLCAFDELSGCWAMPAAPSARIMSVLRTATTKHFFMMHLPDGDGATGMPVTCGRQP
jgi:hypothetical protein